MTVVLRTRGDIDLGAVSRVAWEGENVALDAEAVTRMEEARRHFLALLDDPETTIYGVTSGYGERAGIRLTEEERKLHAALPPRHTASFGEPLPERVARAIVLARLANFLEGHAAVRPIIAEAVVDLLASPLPPVPVHGNGGAGEIIPLSHLFAQIGERVPLEEKDALALINGSPCAAALVADGALAARNRVRLAHDVFALSVEAYRAPLEAYGAELDELWGDPHETAALQGLRGLLAGAATDRRPYQAPVSYRILPRVLGQAHRALAGAEHAAETSLRSVSDNPVFIPPRDGAPPRAFSTGGYHNGQAYPALDALAAAWADLCVVVERHVEALLDDPSGLARARTDAGASDAYVGLLLMVQVGYSEEARGAAQRTLLPRGGFPQNDVASPTFLAWDKERRAGECLDVSLALLAATASQALFARGDEVAPPLAGFLDHVRSVFPPVEGLRALGEDCERLARVFGDRVLAGHPYGTGSRFPTERTIGSRTSPAR